MVKDRSGSGRKMSAANLRLFPKVSIICVRSRCKPRCRNGRRNRKRRLRHEAVSRPARTWPDTGATADPGVGVSHLGAWGFDAPAWRGDTVKPAPRLAGGIALPVLPRNGNTVAAGPRDVVGSRSVTRLSDLAVGTCLAPPAGHRRGGSNPGRVDRSRGLRSRFAYRDPSGGVVAGRLSG